jgi:aminoglycoside phosphotransferase (APT) family kinase protein
MTKNEADGIQADDAKEMARLIIAHHFGNKPKRVVHQTSGLSNFVFMVYHNEGDFVVRISPEATKIQAFMKEQWAMVKAQEAGVPTAEILEVGNHIVPFPYMVSKKVEGEEATFHPNRLQIIKEMGRYAALINSIPTNGFGNTFDWSNNQLSHNETWADYLHKELDFDARLQVLKKQKMLPPKQIKKLQTILLKPPRGTAKPSLNHGDIRLKNVIVNDDGQITAFIDWEHATSNLTYWELSLALHDLSIDEKQEFLQGYGLSEKEIVESAPFIKALNLLNYAPAIKRLAEAKDLERLEQQRIRLSGALDLYSLS